MQRANKDRMNETNEITGGKIRTIACPWVTDIQWETATILQMKITTLL